MTQSGGTENTFSQYLLFIIFKKVGGQCMKPPPPPLSPSAGPVLEIIFFLKRTDSFNFNV